MTRIAKQFLRLRVCEHDAALFVHNYDCIGRRFEKITEFLLFLLAMANVPIALENRNRFSGGIDAQGPAAGDRDRAPVAPGVHEFPFPISFLEDFCLDFFQRLGKNRMKKFASNSSADLFSLPAVEAFSRAVPIENLLLEAADKNCVVSEFEEFSVFAVHRLADAEIEFEFAPVLYFFLKRGVGKEPLLWAGKVEGLWHKPNQKERSDNRGGGSDSLDDACQPVVRMPEVPNFHDVRSSTGNDKYSEADKDPAKGEIAPFADEPDERDGYRKICQRDYQV